MITQLHYQCLLMYPSASFSLLYFSASSSSSFFFFFFFFLFFYLQELEVLAALGQDGAHAELHVLLGTVHIAVNVAKGNLRLNHPELGLGSNTING